LKTSIRKLWSHERYIFMKTKFCFQRVLLADLYNNWFLRTATVFEKLSGDMWLTGTAFKFTQWWFLGSRSFIPPHVIFAIEVFLTFHSKLVLKSLAWFRWSNRT
jgi:hypothetical protein